MSDQSHDESNFTPAPRVAPSTNTTPSIVVVNSIQDENVTAAFATYGNRYFATGSSKRAPGDEKDYQKASDLAAARAMIRLGREILRHYGARSY